MRTSGRKLSWEVKDLIPADISHIESVAECCQQNTHPQPGDLHNRQRERDTSERERMTV